MTRILMTIAMILAVVPAHAAEVMMAVGRSLPPYIIVDEWRGLEYDVVRESLALEGHTIKPKFMAFARLLKEMESGQVDAAMTMRPDSGVKACYSDVHVSYRNVVITLASRNLTINHPSDLAGKSVLAFQNAATYLGPDFKAMAAANPHYREEARQMVQPTLLFLGRVDAVVSDRYIFGWFASDPEVRAKADIEQTVRIHPLFPPTDYRVAFRDPDLCASFNRGLRKLRESGAYDRIVKRYSSYLKEEGGD
ncbi:substrate-binding periplasmic protein [Magnetospirillum aberrantis]|uniref:Amino acid ABC transporter substrate-binding protein n=1 Tax=Magnetospirillum aberrantis SpK TaxID=908842 RepID=A0A7C9QSZ6_9PROT|nr:transporter substrate-binding domain-containing protein [Magnetospirillum aberrantis]NFV78736.1 amino acid ABC transporter substrate-binding protein [Magnetospirillum aberrantis SpK]